MTFIVATNVFASSPPERRPTGMPHARAKKYRKAEYVQCRVCFVNVQSSLHENVVFSVSARTCIAAYVIFIMWNSISGLDACYHFRTSVVERLSW